MTGNLVWMTVDDDTTKVEHIALCGMLLAAGVTTELPSPQKSSDLFKRAVKQTNKRVETSWNAEWHPAGTDNTYVFKALKNALGVTMMTLQFNKDTEQIDMLLPDDFKPVSTQIGDFTEIVDSIRATVENESALMAPYSVREYIRRVLTDAFHAVSLGFGCMYVPDGFSDDLKTFGDVIAVLEGCEFDIVTVADDERSKMSLARRVSEALMEAVAFRTERVDEMQHRGKSISKSWFEYNLDSAAHLKSTIELTNESLDGNVHISLAELDAKLQKLLGLVKI